MAKPNRLLYDPQACRDLEDIFDYIRTESVDRATKMLDLLNRRVMRLVNFPLLGVIPNDTRLQKKGYRVLVVEEYLIFYVLKGRVLRIRRVIHGARRYKFLL